MLRGRRRQPWPGARRGARVRILRHSVWPSPCRRRSASVKTRAGRRSTMEHVDGLVSRGWRRPVAGQTDAPRPAALAACTTAWRRLEQSAWAGSGAPRACRPPAAAAERSMGRVGRGLPAADEVAGTSPHMPEEREKGVPGTTTAQSRLSEDGSVCAVSTGPCTAGDLVADVGQMVAYCARRPRRAFPRAGRGAGWILDATRSPSRTRRHPDGTWRTSITGSRSRTGRS